MSAAAADAAERETVIVSAVRTPLGGFQGSLSALSATQLGGIAMRAAVERARVKPSDVDEVFMGNVCSANLGQAPATQAMLAAGLPNTVPCTVVNKVCASGLKAVMLADQAIRTGAADVVVAGGMESMSNVPHYMPSSRQGLRMGHGEVVDGLIKDGLWDPYSQVHMGACAEMCASKHGFSRADQDAHAAESHARANAAAAIGHTAWEVVPVTLPNGRVVSADDGPSKMDLTKLPRLRTVFAKDGNGTVTAGNASPVTDGAAALVLCSRAKAAALGLPVLARVRAHADAATAPEWFTTAPALAVPKALHRAGLSVRDVDFWEVNEAFSVVDLANRKLMQLPAERVNAHGGSVALGHPIGASGARILVTLLNVLRVGGGGVGVAAICNGGGGASAIVVEAPATDASGSGARSQSPKL
uniref:acetyl-CoA C-acetyltransferase n=1 Tax=Chlamydomonas euryale TaxID=1486919 RepID=A0A7R9YUI8_9CHLO|mmetsp:Transcript_25459/g.75250  ORF Transcript_25459/g.75250 Transcript_25459/m.75250 type:complete len:416 (+) Transcript_25459:558-1805(+)